MIKPKIKSQRTFVSLKFYLLFENKDYNFCKKIDIEKPNMLLHNIHRSFSDVCKVIFED